MALDSVETDGPRSPYEPVAADARFGAPRAGIDPDRTASWLRRVWPILAVRRRAVVVAWVCALVAMLAQVAVPYTLGQAIDEALTERTASLAPFVWTLVALALARGVLTYVYRFNLYRVAFELEYDLRVTMFTHLSRLSFSFFDKVQSGQLISRANSDIRSVQMFLTFAPLMAINVVSVIAAFALMVSVHVPLAIATLVPMPFVYFVGVKMRGLMFPVSWVVQARTADIATIVEENVTGSRVVKSFAAEEAQVKTLTRAARRLRWAAVRQVDVRARYAPIMENLPRVGMVVVLLYGGALTIDGTVTVGTIVAFSTYVVLLQAPFRMLGFLMMMGQRAAASAGRIYEILDTRPEIVDHSGAVDLVDPVGRVEMKKVSFAYAGKDPVLDAFDLKLEPGEIVALVGRTGSGKSTVARLLTRFYDVGAGRVSIDGNDVRDLTLVSLRAQVATVLDEPFLFSASIRDNIAYGRPDADFADIEAAARAASAAEFIERLPNGYDTQIGERGYTLSGGQRQRVAIARTLLVDPKVLVLDDATSAIDVRVEEEIHNALTELVKGRTTLVIAHRLSTISLADRVVLLDEGRIVADGTHVELLASEPRYAEVLDHLAQEDRAHEDGAALARDDGDLPTGDPASHEGPIDGASPGGCPVAHDSIQVGE